MSICFQMSELPDKWNKCKKSALMAKQTIGPIQAYQIDLIGKRVILFETRLKIFRAQFRSETVNINYFFSNGTHGTQHLDIFGSKMFFFYIS